MPNLQTIRAAVGELPEGAPLVVALFGGTTGIGSYIAEAWATTFAKHGSKLRVYIVGRNAARAEALLKVCRVTSPGSDWRFVQATDLSLMSEVDKASQEITRQEEQMPFAGGAARLDALYLSQAQFPLQRSPATSEGIDTQMSLLYYSRMRIIQNLSPLLLACTKPAHVISVFAGNTEDSTTPGELPIGTPPTASYGVTSVRKHTTFMKTFFFEELAEKHAGKVSFIHIFPGLVDGPTFYSDVNPLWIRISWRVLKPLMSWYMTSPEVCGHVMLFLATNRYPAKGTATEGNAVSLKETPAYSSLHELGGGSYAVGQRGDESKGVSWAKVRKEDTGKKIWDHTVKVLTECAESN